MDRRLKLEGNSGCTLKLKGDRVLKISKDVNYNSRLKAQIEKQKAFQPFSVFKAPVVYRDWKQGDLLTVEMEYIPSDSFVEFFLKQNIEDIDKFISELVVFFTHEIEAATTLQVGVEVFWKKLEQICTRFEIPFVLEVKDYLSSVGNYLELPVGPCHGDLTLSNMLFTQDGVYLIDFLDSYIDSPLQDISKLRQDTAHYWSFQKTALSTGDEEVLKSVCGYVDKKLDTWFREKYTWYGKYYKLFQLFNMLRIFPYSKNERTQKYLTCEVLKLLRD